MSEYFDYRNVLGAWINDISSVPRVEQWPSTVLDAADWEPCFGDSIPPERGEAVRRILDAAHSRDVQVLYGLGLYSWGFDKIIAEDQNVRGTNPRVMCASKQASHETMERLVDFLLTDYPLDGFHFESGDLGRCDCDRCAEKPDTVYHRELNERVAKYVRSRWPGRLVEVFVPGTAQTSQEDWRDWSEASQYFDFLIDDWNRANRFGCHSRKRIISALKCAYGTRSGLWIYPPQRWDRLRWFLPIIEQRSLHYRKLADDGGRAAMIQAAPIVNPGTEATLRSSGKFLQDPYRGTFEVLCETVEEMFRPATRAVTEELADLFWAAEKAYNTNALGWGEGGELWLEPLMGVVPGPPTYLSARMYSHKLTEYEMEMRGLQQRFARIRKELGEQDRTRRLETCLANVLADIAKIQQDEAYPRYPFTVVDENTWDS